MQNCWRVQQTTCHILFIIPVAPSGFWFDFDWFLCDLSCVFITFIFSLLHIPIQSPPKKCLISAIWFWHVWCGPILIDYCKWNVNTSRFKPIPWCCYCRLGNWERVHLTKKGVFLAIHQNAGDRQWANNAATFSLRSISFWRGICQLSPYTFPVSLCD